MRLIDLVTDEKTGRVSTSKLWLNIGYAALTYALLRSPLTADIVFAYGAVVAGNNVAIYWLKRRYHARDPGPAE